MIDLQTIFNIFILFKDCLKSEKAVYGCVGVYTCTKQNIRMPVLLSLCLESNDRSTLCTKEKGQVLIVTGFTPKTRPFRTTRNSYKRHN